MLFGLLAAFAMAVAAPVRPALHWDGPPATRFSLELQPLDVSPDGALRVLARVRLFAAGGNETHLPGGGDFEFTASRGTLQWQPRLRYGGPAAIVRLSEPGPLAVHAVARDPKELGTAAASLDAGAALGGVAVRALGSHSVVAGWFPAPRTGRVTIERSGTGPARSVTVPAAAATWTDRDVVPGGRYRYVVRRRGADPVIAAVDVALDGSPGRLARLRGKSAWLAFSGAAWDPDGYGRLGAAAMAARAAGAGLHAVLLRMAYGEYWESTREATPAIDALVDAFASRGIAVVGWTIPRQATYEDIATALAAAAYRTPAGNGIAGLAVDYERGAEYFGSGPAARSAMASYAIRLRAAAGQRALIVSTVEDPALEHLDDGDVPYAALAAASDALQPMTYWRALRGAPDAERARMAVRDGAVTLRRLAGRGTPLICGAQTADIGGGTGAPAAAEVVAATGEARRLGALGVTYYDWFGTSPALWRAVTAARW